MSKVKLKDPELILCSAFRYALGRKTYVVGAVVDEVITNWDNLPSHVKERLKTEIHEYEDVFGSLGTQHDKDDWYRVLELPI